MDSVDRLARYIADLHKQNRNPPSSSPRVGTVIGTGPLKIQWGDHVILTEDKLFLPKIYTIGYQIPNRWQNTSGDIVEDTILWKIDFAIGDKAIIIPDEHLKMWYLVDILN